jgi:flagellar assembly protein FliH
MSSILPKEKQSAYERWELASFAEGDANTSSSAKQSQEQAEKLRQETKSGYDAGFAEGRNAGLAAGRADAARELTSVRQVAAAFAAEVGRANETVAQDMLALALDLAKAMLKTSLQVKPELILPVVGEAIRYLPSLQQPALLFLNPQDAAIVREHMGDELTQSGWRIAEEAQMKRGGCRVETSSNQIDASMETRWQRIAEALSQDSSWLDHP